ncbi:MAG TPA: flavin reductase family protein [Lacipirellulaceae bacterium]|jgi:flavin reductase (DIM6/NTAB) family NADH-FMN oxidoreductase RutF|nr:flavin reductase family protein [Lacipirellulaceae bacterium]
MSSNKSFDRALGHIPSGIFILTVGTGNRATGMLSSWVMQAGFEPPMISVAIKLGRNVCDWLTEGQPFVLNVVREGQKELLRHFNKSFEPGEPAFEGIEISHCARGVPILKDSLGHLECEPAGYADSGDHRVFLAKVVRGKMTDDNARPMVHVRNSGERY